MRAVRCGHIQRRQVAALAERGIAFASLEQLGPDLVFEDPIDGAELPIALLALSDKDCLQQLALRSRRGDDLIAYLHDVAVREQQAAALERAQDSIGLLARIASYVEIKPSVFGVAIDLKAILRDISDRHSASDRLS